MSIRDNTPTRSSLRIDLILCAILTAPALVAVIAALVLR